MLQKLADHIATCLACAAEAEQRAADATNETTRADNEKLARTWRHLASSYQFVQSLERFLLDAKEDKGARPPDPFPPAETAFDPETIAVLAAAYAKSLEGQSDALREAIAKRIIELASKGERDPDKLCQGALVLITGEPPTASLIGPGRERSGL